MVGGSASVISSGDDMVNVVVYGTLCIRTLIL